ncbi:MAG: LLM class flavin-dependent oxidoreductase [Chloroflexi bacterium]|nr:LLM class flavin-dependent oxidoreductase [Chloroflexota bacterium]
MAQRMIGVAVAARDAAGVLGSIERLEGLGIPAAWLTTGGAGLDGLTLFAAAAAKTGRIKLGTAITPTFPRHPIVVVQQVQILAHLAPGRFRLGLGPSHQATIEQSFGIPFKAPHTHLREYIHIVRELLWRGAVDFDGRHLKAHARIAQPIADVPIMASALRQKGFELCGEIADGAISWVCPGVYLRDVALPALRKGAAQAGRPIPPLIAHAPVCVHDNPDEVRAAAREQVGFYPRAPYYAKMFADAGFPEASQGIWSDAMIDAVVLWGDEARVAGRLRELFSWGASEIVVSPVTAGGDRAASLSRTLKLLAEVANSG